MFTVYKVNFEKGRVEPVKCETLGFPNKDENGDVMYFNSHFDTEEAANKHLIEGLNAWLDTDKKELGKLSERQRSLKANMRRIKGILKRLGV